MYQNEIFKPVDYNKQIKEILNTNNITENFSFYYVPESRFNIAILYTNIQNFKKDNIKIPGSSWLKNINNFNIKDVFIIDIDYKSLLGFESYDEFTKYLDIIIRKIS